MSLRGKGLRGSREPSKRREQHEKGQDTRSTRNRKPPKALGQEKTWPMDSSFWLLCGGRGQEKDKGGREETGLGEVAVGTEREDKGRHIEDPSHVWMAQVSGCWEGGGGHRGLGPSPCLAYPFPGETFLHRTHPLFA